MISRKLYFLPRPVFPVQNSNTANDLQKRWALRCSMGSRGGPPGAPGAVYGVRHSGFGTHLRRRRATLPAIPDAVQPPATTTAAAIAPPSPLNALDTGIYKCGALQNPLCGNAGDPRQQHSPYKTKCKTTRLLFFFLSLHLLYPFTHNRLLWKLFAAGRFKLIWRYYFSLHRGIAADCAGLLIFFFRAVGCICF